MSFEAGDIEPSENRAGRAPAQPALVPLPPPRQVTFTRTELDLLLRLYGRRVAEGEWRDYAIDFLKDRAVFSVFRRAGEWPIYRIEKDPARARRQGAFSLLVPGGRILKRGDDLARVLAVIDKPVRLVVD